MKFKPIHLIEQKVLNTIKAAVYAKGIHSLQEYLALPKFIPQDGFIHGSVNVNDINLRLNEIQADVWRTGPVEFFINHLQHNWKIDVSEGIEVWLKKDDEKIGPFKCRYDAAVYGVNLLMKGEE